MQALIFLNSQISQVQNWDSNTFPVSLGTFRSETNYGGKRDSDKTRKSLTSAISHAQIKEI